MLMQTVDQAIRSQKAVPQKGRRKAGVKTAEATLTQVARMYLYSANTDVLRRKTIVYLPHKVPDRVSCLDGILAAGVVGDVNISWGSESERPFIPQTRPPYKA